MKIGESAWTTCLASIVQFPPFGQFRHKVCICPSCLSSCSKWKWHGQQKEHTHQFLGSRCHVSQPQQYTFHQLCPDGHQGITGNSAILWMCLRNAKHLHFYANKERVLLCLLASMVSQISDRQEIDVRGLLVKFFSSLVIIIEMKPAVLPLSRVSRLELEFWHFLQAYHAELGTCVQVTKFLGAQAGVLFSNFVCFVGRHMSGQVVAIFF